jgi:hypothetical protein
MPILTLGNSGATTQDWLRATEGMELNSYDTSLWMVTSALEVVEPDQAVNLPAVERARLNRAMPGIEPPAEHR